MSAGLFDKIVIGEYDDLGNPCIDFHLLGVKHDPPGVRFRGIVDTGFTGFLQLPIEHAFSLGLPLEGTVDLTLADASKGVCLTALAKLTLQDVTVTGIVMLAPQSDSPILLGMDFLRLFERALIVSRTGIFLMDEANLPSSNPTE